jgi:hypothetical protein
MKTAALLASGLITAVSVNHVAAQVVLYGVDSVETVVNAVLGSCPGTAGITWIGGASGSAENQMVLGKQQIAPMQRKVKCSLQADNPASEGKVLGYQVASFVRSQCTYSNGDCQAFSADEAAGLPDGYVWQAGSDSGPYPLACDKLRVLYFGRDHNNVTNCSSPLRQALVDAWDEIFEGVQTESCTQLRHAFRASDATDTLKAFCALPTVTNFCNGTSYQQDNDPIRRPAPPANYDIARADGTLGVVLPISIPTAANVYSAGTPVANTCNAGTLGSTTCSSGTFRFRSFPGFARCPGDTPRRGGLCRVPVVAATGSARCINSAGNRPAGSAMFDARVYNNNPRNDDGSVVPGATSAFYRLHETRSYFGNGCKQLDATQQIACLTAANGCSEGFIGRDGVTQPGIRGVQVASAAGVCSDPTPENVVSGAYPLVRKVYLNTLKGFSAVTGAEAALSQCFDNEAVLEPAMSAAGFVPDPAVGIQVEAFGADNCF